jgi:hypothetical protein
MIADPAAVAPRDDTTVERPDFEALLATLRKPQNLEDTEATLIELGRWLTPEALVRPEPECAIELILTLTTKMRFYILVLAAQNFLIRDIRQQLLAAAEKYRG